MCIIHIKHFITLTNRILLFENYFNYTYIQIIVYSIVVLECCALYFSSVPGFVFFFHCIILFLYQVRVSDFPVNCILFVIKHIGS